MGNFTVEKDKNNQYRWILTSSSAYLDRDNEYVTVQALEKAVDRMWETKQFGELRWYHGNIVLGHTDWADVHHHQLIESGTFVDDEVAEAILKSADGLRASIGFNYTPRNRKGNEYHDIDIEERSLLPKGRESNPFTALTVIGGKMAGNHIEELVGLIGEEKALSLLNDAATRQKEADAKGHTRKETKKGWFQQMKEAVAAFAAIPEPDESEEFGELEADTEELEPVEVEDTPKEEELNEEDKPLTKKEVSALIDELRTEFQEARTKEAGEIGKLATKEEVQALKEANDKAIVVTAKALEEVDKQVKELRGDQPRALVFGSLFGSRPSNDETNVTGKAAKKPDKKEGAAAWVEELDKKAAQG